MVCVYGVCGVCVLMLVEKLTFSQTFLTWQPSECACSIYYVIHVEQDAE